MPTQGGDVLYAERLGISGRITVDEIKTYLGLDNLSQGYSVFPIVFEENGGLTDNNRQWSQGNGSTGVVNGTMPDCEVFAMSFHAETAGASVSIELMRNDVSVASTLFTGGNGFNELPIPIQVSEGQFLGLRTQTETGAYTDCRVYVWVKIPFLGLKGEKGDAGSNGVPNQCMRVELSGQSNVNGTNVTLALSSSSINTIAGATLTGNDINLPAGIYDITLEVSTTTTVQRANLGFRFMKDGALYSQRSGGNYVRSASGHNEAGDSISDLVEYTTSGTLSFQSFLQGAAGTVNLTANSSRVLIHKIS